MNGFNNRYIFSGWMGPGEMSEAREKALLSLIRNTGCPNIHLTVNTLVSWRHPAFPFHPAFPYLSAVHQCDYLRCYSMHVYGGGYADVKHTIKNWNPFFNALATSNAFGAGYTEVGPQGVARVGGQLEEDMKANFNKIVGVCAIIFRPQTEFTTEWFARLNKLLDDRYETLKKNPAKHPQDRFGAQFTDGSTSEYPFAWTEVGGDIFHPLAYQYHEQIIQLDMAPSFQGYR